MIRHNGVQRAVKTVARKALGVDRAYERALRAKLGTEVLPQVEIRHGDASQMPFPDEFFDVVYSRAVLHHVHEPKAVLTEVARVLKPGGIAYVSLHLYSSPNGSLDPRLMFGGNTELCWAHLRPDNSLVPGASLNTLRLEEWRGLFAARWPGSKLWTIETEDPTVRQLAGELLADGKISGYSKEELITTTLIVVWQKNARFPSYSA
jgi:SAM-dependent methyltransferase